MSDRNRTPIPRDVRHVLVICPTWVGDCVMATPVFRAIKAALPGAKVTALAQPGLEALLMPCPWFDAFLGVNAKGLAGTRKAAKAVRELTPAVDAALVMPNSFRSALVAWLARVPRRVGVRSDMRGKLLTHAIMLPACDGIRTTLEHYALLAEHALGVSPGSLDRTMELHVSAEQQAEADRALECVKQPFVLLNPGAVRENKRWPAERFAAAADALATKCGMGAAVTGSPGEREILAAVTAAARSPIVNLAERGITLGSLKGVIERAALLITNDTGPRHIALALGTPVVSLFGPTDARHTIIPGANEHMLRAEPFLPADKMADDFEKACAIDRISVGDVVAAGEALLSARLAQAGAAREGARQAPPPAES